MENGLDCILSDKEFIDESRGFAHDIGNTVQRILWELGFIELKDMKLDNSSMALLTEHVELAQSNLAKWREYLEGFKENPAGIDKEIPDYLVHSFEILKTVGKSIHSTYAGVPEIGKIARGSRKAVEMVEYFNDSMKGNPPKLYTMELHSALSDILEDGASPTGTEIGRVLDFDEGQFYVTANPILLERIIQNLDKNSVHAIEEKKSKSGCITVRADCCRFEIDSDMEPLRGDYIRVSFSDDGAGIADEVRDRLFGKGASTRSSGLGLYGSREMAHGMGGGMGWEESLTDGATFYVYLREAYQLDVN